LVYGSVVALVAVGTLAFEARALVGRGARAATRS
jgi:hypothetical protein